MEYEIDFMPVGENKKGGDAITLRYGNLENPREQEVVIIDGGTREAGKLAVNHIKNYYKTNHVNLAVSTHLHQDHASGLFEVLENLKVDKLAMHLPWEHAANIKSMFSDGRLTISRLETKLEKSLQTISELEKLAKQKDVEIIEPFAGTPLADNLFIFGPTKKYYQMLVANFENTPKIKEQFKIITEGARSFSEKTINWIRETLDMESETLKDNDKDTNSENNSSTILLFIINGEKFLFTGDAGKDALYNAIDYAEKLGVNLEDLHFLDIPHHGSHRNIEPSILEKIKTKTAFISAPKKGDPKHPSRKVVNALIRRETLVYVNNQGQSICYPSENAPGRGWQKAELAKFNDLVEE